MLPLATCGEGEAPTAAADNRATVGAQRPGLPAPAAVTLATPPLIPPAYHTSPPGGRSSRSGEPRARQCSVDGAHGGGEEKG